MVIQMINRPNKQLPPKEYLAYLYLALKELYCDRTVLGHSTDL